MEWLSLAVRWIHVIAGVAWIGASFYFNWLEGNLDRQGKSGNLEGDLWAVHGGGFYHVEKLKGAPEPFPRHLHWFKWEAYLTWVSGVVLLGIVYYYGARANLLDPSRNQLTPIQGMLIGLGSLPLGWVCYDSLCKAFKDSPRILASIVFSLLVLAAFAYSLVFGSKGAYIHVGALIGTLMAGNVFWVIIPAQKIQVAAARADSHPVDPAIGKKGLTRSLHNNYFTLPILFIMISNHYPMTYGHQYNWLVLAAISIIGMATRHFFNLKNKGQMNVWILPTAALAMIALALVTSPVRTPAPAGAARIQFSQIDKIFAARCRTCHSPTPTDDVFTVPPNGVLFETQDQIVAQASQIRLRAVDTSSMPLGNKTNMTAAERSILGQWLNQLSQGTDKD